MKHSHARVERPWIPPGAPEEPGIAPLLRRPNETPILAVHPFQLPPPTSVRFLRIGFGLAQADQSDAPEKIESGCISLLAAGLEEGDQFLIGFLAIESGGLFPCWLPARLPFHQEQFTISRN